MRRFIIVLCCVSVSWIAVAEEPLKRLSLEALFEDKALAIESLSGVTWLPDGEHFIFTTSKGGEQTLWKTSTRGGAPGALADWSEVMTGLAAQRPEFEAPLMSDPNSSASDRLTAVLSPDGSALVGGYSGDLYFFDLEKGTARFLTGDGEQEIFPAFNADGTEIAFVKGGDIYRLDLGSGVVYRVTDRGQNKYLLNGVADWVYEEELGVERSYWWSPDGQSIAFLQTNEEPVGIVPITGDSMPFPELEKQWYPKAGTENPIVRVGVVSRDGGDPVWLETGDGDYYLARAGWTPGGEVWVQRLNRDQNVLDLMVGDPATGKVRTLLTEKDPAWINITDDLRFLSDGSFLWTSERNGWRHLYHYSADGSRYRTPTDGEWQIEKILGVDADERTAFIQANAEDHRQRHLYRVDLESGETTLLGKGQRGSHDGALSPDGDYVIDQWSTRDTPPRADLLKTDGTFVRRIWESGKELEGWDLLPIEEGSITASDGTELYSLLIKPRDFDPTKKYPVLQYVYGGPHSQLTQDSWRASIHNTYRLIADHGIAVFLLDNRGTWARGKAFETAVYRKLGQLEVADQVDGAKWLARQPWVDPTRIGVYGGSYGGYMTLLCLLKAPEYFSAGIAYAPVTDWALYDTIYTERYMDTPQDNPEGYAEGAPLTHAENLQGALLLGHGTMDNNVHFQNSLNLIARLAAADKDYDLVVYPRTRHGIRRSSYALHFHREKLEFLIENLLGKGVE